MRLAQQSAVLSVDVSKDCAAINHKLCANYACAHMCTRDVWYMIENVSRAHARSLAGVLYVCPRRAHAAYSRLLACTIFDKCENSREHARPPRERACLVDKQVLPYVSCRLWGACTRARTFVSKMCIKCGLGGPAGGCACRAVRACVHVPVCVLFFHLTLFCTAQRGGSRYFFFQCVFV